MEGNTSFRNRRHAIKIAAGIVLGALLLTPSLLHAGKPKASVARAPARSKTISRTSTVQSAYAQKVGKNLIETNSIGMKLALIPPGEFLMGTPAKEAEKVHKQEFADADGKLIQMTPLTRENETPQHTVRITKAFYLGQHEVTRGEFRQFVRATKHRTDGEKNPWTPHSWSSTSFPQTDEHPVVCVRWNDAVAFCKWLSDRERVSYRLPTEAEWEYACRAGSTSDFCFGNDSEELVRYANILDATAKNELSHVPWLTFTNARDGYNCTSPIGLFRPNAFRIYDMHGNVQEWCQDYYTANYYAQSPVEDPQGPLAGEEHVARGGFYGGYPHCARSAFRATQIGIFMTGFRVVRTTE